MQKVVLVGYMGSGKSIIGQLLSEKTGINFVDLDKIIEQRQNATIEMIFQNHGELFFRKLENQIFNELLQSSQQLIISTGGGTPCYYDNYKMLAKDDVISVYLKASIDTLYNRLVSEKSKRPLLYGKTEDEMMEFIAKHLFDRSFYYNKSKFKIAVDNKSPQTIVDEVLCILA